MKNTGVGRVVDAKDSLRTRMADILMENSQKMVFVEWNRLWYSLSGSYMAIVVERTSADKYGKIRVKVACINEEVGSTIKDPALVSTPYWPTGIVYGGYGLGFAKDLCIEALENQKSSSMFSQRLEV